MEYLYIYIGGAFAWAFVMALKGEGVNPDFMVGMVIWPVMLVSVIGQLVRKCLGMRPIK